MEHSRRQIVLRSQAEAGRLTHAATPAALKTKSRGSAGEGVATNMSSVLAQVDASELKDEFMAFLKSRKQEQHQHNKIAMEQHQHNKTAVQQHQHNKVTVEQHQQNKTAVLSCAEQWERHSTSLKRSVDELFDGMKKVRQAHVLLAGVDSTHWSRYFSGSRDNDRQSAENVQRAIRAGGTLLGRLDGLGDEYADRLKLMGGADQKEKFMSDCQSGAKDSHQPAHHDSTHPTNDSGWIGDDRRNDSSSHDSFKRLEQRAADKQLPSTRT